MVTDLLTDKTIVISGGTKSVGRELAIACAIQGANVVIGGRDSVAADQAINKINDIKGHGIFVHTDLHKIESCNNLFESAMNEYGRLDGFVNYAGITYKGSLTDCSEEIYDEIFDINIKAAFFCTQNAINYMKKSGSGSIILIGSPHAWSGEKDRAAYACSKGALLTLMEHIAHNYGTEHIRCNYLTMGWTVTEGEIALRKADGMSVDELENLVINTLPMGRLIEFIDYIPGIIYLLSDYSSMVTGANLRITGGQYI